MGMRSCLMSRIKTLNGRKRGGGRNLKKISQCLICTKLTKVLSFHFSAKLTKVGNMNLEFLIRVFTTTYIYNYEPKYVFCTRTIMNILHAYTNKGTPPLCMWETR